MPLLHSGYYVDLQIHKTRMTTHCISNSALEVGVRLGDRKILEFNSGSYSPPTQVALELNDLMRVVFVFFIISTCIRLVGISFAYVKCVSYSVFGGREGECRGWWGKGVAIFIVTFPGKLFAT